MKKIKTIIIIILNTLILLILIEVALRVFFPRKKTLEESSLAYQYNSDYLVSLKPNIEKEFTRTAKNGGNIITWKTNKYGFRGDNIIKKDLTIAVYGDSNIQARFSSLENTYVKKLEQYLPNSVSVINAGVVGYGPDQSFLKFKKEKNIIQPDIVILNVFADNDYGDLLRNRLIKLNDNQKLEFLSSQKSIDPVFDTSKNSTHKWYHLRMKDAVRKFRDNYIGNPSLLPENIIKTYSRVCQEEFENYQNNSDKIYSNFADHYDMDIAVDPESKNSKIKIELMEAIVKEFNNFTMDNSIEFIVLIQPSSIDISKNFLINYDDISKRFPKYKNDNLTSIMYQICKKNKIKAINLYDTFIKNNPSKYYFIDGDSHWNDVGQDSAAKVTATYLQKQVIQDSYLSKKNKGL
ncbi:hypothetical protein [Jejuia spongiicola]|uniref:AlgX/AlgJ SGNH hydrolase-like domain-containing protein n=1 Tax=Jejuia spongiicola TaxID=2942207 RepID=A0ABT0QBT7_9FLAO|nr:hypothetical protein [Jejuia spongiicola]MCL6294418.1 hypothetical protein [Jejuia spongiicola]